MRLWHFRNRLGASDNVRLEQGQAPPLRGAHPPPQMLCVFEQVSAPLWACHMGTILEFGSFLLNMLTVGTDIFKMVKSTQEGFLQEYDT